MVQLNSNQLFYCYLIIGFHSSIFRFEYSARFFIIPEHKENYYIVFIIKIINIAKRTLCFYFWS